jgi:hypothetical protein
MNRTATGKVKRWEVVQPTIGVPRPTCYRTVDDSGPAESEDHRGKNAATLEATTDDQDHCANAEKHLIKAEDDLREECGSGRGGRNDIFQAKVGEITNEGICCSGICERVAPEHPLEADTVCVSLLPSSPFLILLTLQQPQKTGRATRETTCDAPSRCTRSRFRV